MTLWRQFGIAVAAPILLWSGAVCAQTASPPAQQRPTPQQQGQTPQMVEGQVIKIDRRQGRVTIRAADGLVHEFQASKETLQDLKEGDRIEARLRQP
jgi:Cu/Ag efflux protein CusF